MLSRAFARDAKLQNEKPVMYAVEFTQEEINYILKVLEPISKKDEKIDNILDAFDLSYEVENNA